MSKFIFFWKTIEKPYGCFSNWYRSNFTVEGITFSCVEQYMMWKKALLFNDKQKAEEILQAKFPWEYKAKGKEVKGFTVDVWEKVCKDIVYEGCYQNFTQNKNLLEILLSTKGHELVEASPMDVIWGIGLSFDDPRALDKSTWRGKNYLGEVLTKLREDILNK